MATRDRTDQGTTMAKASKKSTKKPAAFKPQVHVRMYRQGLGDCFLLRFESKKAECFNVLIDCGIYKASPGAGDLMNEVVKNVRETTGGKIDVLVSTHEHWDHISGFHQAIDEFKKMTIGQVWQAWTEDPANALANQLRKKYEGAKAKLVGLMRTALAGLGTAKSQSLDDAFSVMGFFGIDKVSDESGPYEKIKELMAANHPRYCLPGDVLTLGKTGVKAFVLGPPASEAILRKQDIDKDDAYQKQKAFFDGFNAMLDALEAGLDGDSKQNEANQPFDFRERIPVDVARGAEFFQTYYGFDAASPDAYRSIDDVALDTFGSLALRMDNYINNTSLVLAFQLPTGKVLLFPGDAQGGNWKSWADLVKPLAFESENINAHDLLSATVLYKVAHHGSHNATPRTFGLELMTDASLRAFVPVDHTIAQQARYGEMPLVAIMEGLKKRTSGKVVRSDDSGPSPHADFRFSTESLRIPLAKAGKTIERPLYCETSFDLNGT